MLNALTVLITFALKGTDNYVDILCKTNFQIWSARINSEESVVKLFESAFFL